MTATPPHYRALGADSGGGRPVAAVLRIGDKAPKGNPINATGENAGFRVVRAEALGTAAKLTRPPHGAFSAYNDLPAFDRRSFNALLPYAALTDNWEQRRTAKELVGYPRQPSRFVTCESHDGETAVRLYALGDQVADTEWPDDEQIVEGTPSDEQWFRIPCPGDLCPHTQRRECLANSTLYLISDEEDCPHVLVRFWTGGAQTTVRRIAAFFDDVHRMVGGLGLELENYIGLPVVLNLGQGSDKKAGKRYPVVTLALREVATLALKAQREAIEAAGGHLELPPAIIEGEVIPPETELAKAHDAVDASPGKPQVVVGDDQPELFK